MSCFIIAEAGVNHNGRLDLALELIDAAAAAGADAVKFQTFRAERLVARGTPTAAYQDENCGARDQWAMLRALELPDSAYEALTARCAARGIEFLSTPFDSDSARMLVGYGMRRVKIGSGDLTSVPFLAEIAAFDLPVILSTGMATLQEVNDGVEALISAWRKRGGSPNEDMLTLLHCTSNYPARAEDVNLRAMTTLREAFKLPVGYSDHTEGIEVAIGAVALGARVIEKHLTLDRALAGPDHKASLEPAQFSSMVRGIRSIEAALGSAEKAPCESELAVRALVRRSLALGRTLKAGELIRAEDIVLLRPGTGIAPASLAAVVGRKAVRDVESGTLLSWSDLA